MGEEHVSGFHWRDNKDLFSIMQLTVISGWHGSIITKFKHFMTARLKCNIKTLNKFVFSQNPQKYLCEMLKNPEKSL